MMRRMELWFVLGLLAAAIPVQAQQDDNKKQHADANAAAAQAAHEHPARGRAGHPQLDAHALLARLTR